MNRHQHHGDRTKKNHRQIEILSLQTYYSSGSFNFYPKKKTITTIIRNTKWITKQTWKKNEQNKIVEMLLSGENRTRKSQKNFSSKKFKSKKTHTKTINKQYTHYTRQNPYFDYDCAYFTRFLFICRWSEWNEMKWIKWDRNGNIFPNIQWECRFY